MTLAQLSPQQVQVTDPLTAIARQTRHLLLGASLATIAVVHVGLVPSKVSALGIEFTPANQAALVLLLGVVVTYLLVAFLLYAWADLAAWRLSYVLSQDSAGKDLATEVDDAKARLDSSYQRLRDGNKAVLELANRLGSGVDLKMDGAWVSRKTSWFPGSMKAEDKELFQDAMSTYVQSWEANESAAKALEGAEKRRPTLKRMLFDSRIAIARRAFDFLFPLLAGGYALVAVAVYVLRLR